MEKFSELQSLWLTNIPDSLPKFAKMEQIILQYRQKETKSNIFTLSIGVVVIGVLLVIMIISDFRLWSTFVGLGLFMILAGILVYVKIKNQVELSNLETLSNQKFIVRLEREEQETCIGKSNFQTALFMFWATGFAFYIYEFISDQMTLIILGYSALVLFGAIMWFLYRPYMTRRYQKNIQKTLNHIKKVKFQMNEKI